MNESLVSAEEIKHELDLFFKKHPAQALEVLLWPLNIGSSNYFRWIKLVLDGKAVFIEASEWVSLLVHLNSFFKPLLERAERNIWLGSYYGELDYKDEIPRLIIYKDLDYLTHKVHQRIEQHQADIRRAYNALADEKILLVQIAHKK